ncbi:MAG: hypothetical protein K6G62_00750 [Eubacterium sp.]|nr:hypothetical protein [Eubacterium sp.]
MSKFILTSGLDYSTQQMLFTVVGTVSGRVQDPTTGNVAFYITNTEYNGSTKQQETKSFYVVVGPQIGARIMGEYPDGTIAVVDCVQRGEWYEGLKVTKTRHVKAPYQKKDGSVGLRNYFIGPWKISTFQKKVWDQIVSSCRMQAQDIKACGEPAYINYLNNERCYCGGIKVEEVAANGTVSEQWNNFQFYNTKFKPELKDKAIKLLTKFDGSNLVAPTVIITAGEAKTTKTGSTFYYGDRFDLV